MTSPLRIILVRPRNPGNIGACARAMGNFGFTDLVVVDPYPPIWQETRSAPDAESIVLNARTTLTVEEAIRGCSRVFGTSSLAHRQLEQAIFPLPQLQNLLSQKKPKERIALIFGSERSGLSNHELSQCDAVIQIPMARPRVSMNLAQAVAVILYEWTRSGSPAPARELSGVKEKNEVIEAWIQLADVAGYPPGYTASTRAGRIRKAMQTVEMTPEVGVFLKSFSRWVRKKLLKVGG